MDQNNFQQYGQPGWNPNVQTSFSAPNVFVPQNPSPTPMGNNPGGQTGGSSYGTVDPFLSGVAGTMLRQQGHSYLQRSQAYMQSKIGFLSGSSIHYLFDVTPSYVGQKLLMLMFPFLRKWTYSRIPDQLSGHNKYQPAKQDTNAPDLYIPVASLWTYCLLIGVSLFASKAFKPELVYNTVSLSLGAWFFHALVIKILLWVLGIGSSVSILELGAYAGYSFVYGCLVLISKLTLGNTAGHVVWVYCSLTCALFLVRTVKRILFQESNQYGPVPHQYLLLGLGVFQFPFLAWLSRITSV